eukprot:gnl/TRDRNA2_/TRDRNA2_86866_c0_seq3.p2 gnl/TRDRNA2_/TRDRNA2_86866_c0~~gnl/TRDRNA2_/TRDRNA2_86866_c0_seq3.p2  ORF type:complete len:195 (-),score=31.00 gnl/TRDRNA2_/TRDRNA2_86866_c0_seq3:472-1056(-)
MRALTLALASLGLALSARIKSSHVPNQQCALNDLQNASEASKVKAMNTTAPVEVNVGEPEVLEVNAVSLWAMMEAKQRNILVTFYHPQCPYCRDFLMRGEDGTRESAPLEVLNRDLQDEENRPDVVKFDTSEKYVPIDFYVPYVPRIYRVKTNGEKKAFEGNRTNYPELKAFALDKPYSASFLLRRTKTAVPSH